MPVWRVEFDRDAARDLRKRDVQDQRDILRYLRERIAPSGIGARCMTKNSITYSGNWVRRRPRAEPR
jgi:hypothetical protein